MAEDVVEITYLVSEEARRAPEEFVAEDVPENHVVSEDVGMLTGVTERCNGIHGGGTFFVPGPHHSSHPNLPSESSHRRNHIN